MKKIKNSKDITTLEVGDVVVFGNLEYVVNEVLRHDSTRYYLYYFAGCNDRIFEILNLKKRDVIEKLGIDADCNCDFPETKSIEALTAIVSALFKEYEKQNELPNTWEEFCMKNKIKEGECHIDSMSNINRYSFVSTRVSSKDKNVCISVQEAEAFLALIQLRQLRKAYVKDWEPDWENDYECKYCIDLIRNEFKINKYWETSHVLTFPKYELAGQFLNNFKDLLEIAKPLL